VGRSQVALDEAGIAPGFEQRGGGGMPEGRDGPAGFVDPGPPFGCAEGSWDTGATHGEGRCRPWFVIAAGGRQEPGLVTGGLPGGAE
jgi:hypothetical protein